MTALDRMFLGVALVFISFKALTLRRLTWGRALGYAVLWPGMDARPFAETVPGAGGGLLVWGLVKMCAGAALLFAHVGIPALDVVRVFAGIGLLVHLGICDVLAGFWRLQGVPVGRLFVNPLASKTLGEFWGRRWNLAFHDVVRNRVFCPAARRWGPATGILLTFVFSGLLHEVLLSVPASGGYGLPFAYFLLHGLLVLAERRWKLAGRVWTLFWVLVPAPLLFHPWFIRSLIWPLT
ncbi:MAG TPA: MBOAT family protein [Planctomycetota bacterium]|nr:MBOAT family protein [Planctomycetota bacterium]